MNSLHIIGNLTADPELRTTSSGKDVCTFTVAVNRRQGEGADFFRVSAWNERAKVCKQYLSKGRKVSVVGPVSVHVYTKNNGEAAASMEVQANDIEFLSPKGEQQPVEQPKIDQQSGYQQVESDELPF